MGAHTGIGTLEDGACAEVSDGLAGVIGHTYAAIEGFHAGNLGGLFLWGFCGSVQGFYYAIGALFLGADSEPALLTVEDVPADGLSKHLFIAIGVTVVIGTDWGGSVGVCASDVCARQRATRQKSDTIKYRFDGIMFLRKFGIT